MTAIAIRSSAGNSAVAVNERGSSAVAVRPGPGRAVVAAGLRGPEGQPGQPGPPGEANIAGYGFNIDQLSEGDMLVFNGSAWGNEHKTSLLDGGNF